MCFAAAEFSVQMGTMKHDGYIVPYLITQICLAPFTNMSPTLFMLVLLVQVHGWY